MANDSGAFAAVAIVAAQVATVLQSRLVSPATNIVHAEPGSVDGTKVVRPCEIPCTGETKLTTCHLRILDSPGIVADRSTSDENISFVATLPPFQADVVAVSATVGGRGCCRRDLLHLENVIKYTLKI